MSKRFHAALLFAVVVLFSCNTKTPRDKRKVYKPETVNGTRITNGIEIESSGIKVISATLKMDNGQTVPADNTIKANEKLNIVLELGDGWKVEDGKCFLGCAEKVTTSSGRTLLDLDDIFEKPYPNGVDPEDAKQIAAYAVVTRKDPTADHYTAELRVWDKKGSAKVKATVKFYAD